MLPWHLPKLGNSHKMLLRTNQLSRRREDGGFTYRPYKIGNPLGRCSLPQFGVKYNGN